MKLQKLKTSMPGREKRQARSHLSLLGLGLALALASSACFGDSERHESWDRTRDVIGPIALKSRLAYVDTARDRVVVIETDEGKPEFRGYSIGRNAIYATTTPDRQVLAVVTRGEEALVKGQIDQDPLLWMVDTTDPKAQPLSYEIGSPFDRLAVASDGSVAVAYFSSGGFDAASGVFATRTSLL